MARAEPVLRRLSADNMDEMASAALSRLQPSALEKPCPVDLEDMAKKLELTVFKGYLSPNGDILGMTVFGEGMVEYVTTSLELEKAVLPAGTVIIMPTDEARERFTLAHELSHWLLHREYYGCGLAALRSLCREQQMGRDFSPVSEGDWIEWQANSMASCLLMPREPFCKAVYATRPHFAARPFFFEGIQEKAAAKTVAALSEIFQVSHAAARIRLKGLGFLRKHD